jgi:hypothetical protein
VLTGVTPDMKVAKEETFGPFAPTPNSGWLRISIAATSDGRNATK